MREVAKVKEYKGYNAGDKVMVRTDLEVGKTYNGFDSDGDVCCHEIPNHEMVQMRGQIVTIRRASNGSYRIVECPYDWSDQMFKKFVDFGVKKTIVTNIESKYGTNIIAVKAVHSGNATILFYKAEGKDKTKKVVVKCDHVDKEQFSTEKGIEIAILKAQMKELKKQLRKY